MGHVQFFWLFLRNKYFYYQNKTLKGKKLLTSKRDNAKQSSMYLSFIKITVHCSSSGFFSEIFRKILVTQTLGFCLSIVCRGHLASQNRFCFGISVTGKISELVFMNSSYNLFSTLPQAAWERERGGTINFVSLVYQLC